MRKCNPDWTIPYQKLDVNRVGVTGGNGHDQRLIATVHWLARPTVDSLEVVVHVRYKTIAEPVKRGNAAPKPNMSKTLRVLRSLSDLFLPPHRALSAYPPPPIAYLILKDLTTISVQQIDSK